MEVSTEVIHSLRILGLPSDATPADVRSAFRQLARTYHPDVAGRLYSRKFEQIAKAYALLKDLPPSVFPHAHGKAESHFSPPRETVRPPKSSPKKDAGRRFSFRSVLGKPFAWYRKRLERVEAERERLRRAAEEARKKILLERAARIEAILERGERLTEDFMNRMERETHSVGVQGLTSRLMSDICQVRHLALVHLGELVNRPEIFEALFYSLQKWDIDGKTARLMSALPLKPENHRKLARDLVARAAAMPDSLLTHLLQLYSKTADRELLENYLNHAGACGISLILRRWPKGAFISEPTLYRLMSHDDESVLVTLFSAMKQRSIPCPKSGLERLNAHLSHPNIAVRVWAKALLSVEIKP